MESDASGEVEQEGLRSGCNLEPSEGFRSFAHQLRRNSHRKRTWLRLKRRSSGNCRRLKSTTSSRWGLA